MEKALHGSDLIDLKTFLEREGIDRARWKIPPCCPECGEPVDPFNVKAALASFKEVKPEIVKRGRHKPGFDHKDNPFDNCPNSFRHDTRFEGLRNLEVDARTRERNRQILMQPDVRLMNRAILNVVLCELTGQSNITETERQKVWRKGSRWLLGISALGEYPWLLPYALALLQDKEERTFKGGKGFLAYRDVGKQLLPYTRVDYEEGQAQVPQAIQLKWVNTRYGKTVYRPFLKGGKTEVIFELSGNASRRLAMMAQFGQSVFFKPGNG